jgi:hypothetical protein
LQLKDQAALRSPDGYAELLLNLSTHRSILASCRSSRQSQAKEGDVVLRLSFGACDGRRLDRSEHVLQRQTSYLRAQTLR